MTRKVCIQEAKDIFLNTLNHKRHIHHKETLKHLINQCWKAIGNTSQGKYVAICIYIKDICNKCEKDVHLNILLKEYLLQKQYTLKEYT